MKNNQYDRECNQNQAAMPQKVCQKVKDVHDDVEKVSYDDEDQDNGNDQNSQLDELVKCNTP